MPLKHPTAISKIIRRGVVGFLKVEFAEGEPVVLKLDSTWKTAKEEAPGWSDASFDDSTWKSSQIAAAFGQSPWGTPGGRLLTLSPVKANPYQGHCALPQEVNLKQSRVYLEMDTLAPEMAARISVNGQDAVVLSVNR